VAPEESAELQALRKRAYGPHPDIDQDPRALARLLDLEAKSRPASRESDTQNPKPDLDHPNVNADAPVVEDSDDQPTPLSVALDALLSAARWLRGLRRSTVLIGLGACLIVFALVTALVVFQRTQTDPLQTGATQVARLQADPTYRLPAFFAGPEYNGFQGFHGLRFVTGGAAYYGPASDRECFTAFIESDGAASTSTSFSGTTYAGCGAGGFPATILISTRNESLPREFRDAFPDAEGVLLVLDQKNNEIVVFKN
jgi:hypothetical protein